MMAGIMITEISHCWLMHDLDLVLLPFIAMINPYFIFKIHNCLIILYGYTKMGNSNEKAACVATMHTA